ncbi:hypothetical protein [Pseudomonas putida]
MAILYTLDKLKAKERFDYWHDVVCSTYAPAESRKLVEGTFDGSLNVKDMGEITLTQIKSLPVEYKRHRNNVEPASRSARYSVCRGPYELSR